jgi:hypothetical protein
MRDELERKPGEDSINPQTTRRIASRPALLKNFPIRLRAVAAGLSSKLLAES